MFVYLLKTQKNDFQVFFYELMIVSFFSKSKIKLHAIKVEMTL